MKLKNLYVAFLFLSVIGFISSCSDDDKYAPIMLAYHGESESGNYIGDLLNMYIFSGEQLIDIYGGYGYFTLEIEDEEVVKATLDMRTITFVPQSEGITRVLIKDDSGKTYPLTVWVGYLSDEFRVSRIEFYIKGESLTLGDKKKLEEEIGSYISVEVKDQYEFSYTNSESTEGIVEFRTSAPEHAKGTFSIMKKQDYNPFKTYSYTITIKIGQQEYTYDYGEYGAVLETRMNYKPSLPPMMLVEDVTDMFKEKYPAMEKALVVQVLEVLE